MTQDNLLWSYTYLTSLSREFEKPSFYEKKLVVSGERVRERQSERVRKKEERKSECKRER